MNKPTSIHQNTSVVGTPIWLVMCCQIIKLEDYGKSLLHSIRILSLSSHHPYVLCMTPKHYLISYTLDQRRRRVHRLSQCPATLLSGMHGVKRQYTFPQLLRVSVVTFPYQLHNLNTWICNYKHAYIVCVCVCVCVYIYIYIYIYIYRVISKSLRDFRTRLRNN